MHYFRSESNIGMISNWNRCLGLNTSPYITILQDDDLLLPSFISESISRLRKYPRAAMSYALARYIDSEGNPGPLQDTSGTPDDPEKVDGFEFLHQVVCPGGWTVHCSAVLLVRDKLSADGIFDSQHARHIFDFNLYVRLAARFEIVPVQKELAYVRLHPQQDSQTGHRSAAGTGYLGYPAERIDALAYLLRSQRAQDISYREWLMERLLFLNAQQSSYAYSLLPDLYWGWQERVQIACREIARIVPAGENFILIDEEQWATGGEIGGRKAIPFIAKDGLYWGPPADDEEAITQLELFRQDGIKTIILGWPAFWWLEHYHKLNKYLYTECHQIQKNSRLIAFNLRPS
jgi:hypothetical protein